jgi:hypothetical protein
VAFDAATRALRGSKTRPRHRVQGDDVGAGGPMPVCAPPPGLSKLETSFWHYYAPTLAASRRLPPKARDTLAKYCTALAVVSGLRAQLASRKRADVGERREIRRELRQWLLCGRLYENDLLLNPASLARAPKVDGAIAPIDDIDEFAEFFETTNDRTNEQ